jgi:hypothetical protein
MDLRDRDDAMRRTIEDLLIALSLAGMAAIVLGTWQETTHP